MKEITNGNYTNCRVVSAIKVALVVGGMVLAALAALLKIDIELVGYCLIFRLFIYYAIVASWFFGFIMSALGLYNLGLKSKLFNLIIECSKVYRHKGPYLEKIMGAVAISLGVALFGLGVYLVSATNVQWEDVLKCNGR